MSKNIKQLNSQEEIFQEQVDNKPIRDEKGRLLPGNTANPGGRPKGSISLITEMRNKLSTMHPDLKKTYAEAFIESLLDDALTMDGPSRKLVLNYIEGLPMQKTELTHIIPKPLDDVSENNNLQTSKDDEIKLDIN